MKELIYKVVDFFTFGKGLKKTFFGYPVRLPTRYINYFPSDYEQDNFDFLIKSAPQNGVVLDIGAHIGLFSMVAAQLTGKQGKVFSFEPTLATRQLLEQTIRMNNMQGTVTPCQQAVSNKEGSIVFYESDVVGDNSNSLVEYLEDRGLKGTTVPVTTVDIFVNQQGLQRVDFIKIDVEGAEYDAIRGAADTLKNFRPYCILAIHPTPIAKKGDQLGDIYDFVVNAGYRVTLYQKPMSREDFCNNKEMIDLHLYPA
jgi:FkbM family methyltransferase